MGVSKVKFGQETLIDLTGDTVASGVLKKGYTAHGSNGELIEGNFEIKNQSKTVTLSTSQQTIKPDSGYNGLSQVTVPAISLQEKTVYPSTSAQTVTPDSGKNGLSKVTIQSIKLQDKTVTPLASDQIILPNTGYDGFSMISVNAAKLQSKTVIPKSEIQTVYPDNGFYGLSAVSVAAAKVDITNLENYITVNSAYGTFYGENGGAYYVVQSFNNKADITNSKITLFGNASFILSSSLMTRTNIGANNYTYCYINILNLPDTNSGISVSSGAMSLAKII